MAEPTTPETAVRRYLMFLEDPASLVDEDVVARAQEAVERATDPLEKLKALADLEHARRTDGDQVLADFVALAKRYADAEDIPVSAFRGLGVPDEVLTEAGFDVGAARGRRRRSTSRPGGRRRAPNVSIETLKAAALASEGPFTLAELAERAGGGAPATVRKAVDELIEAGRARKLGPKPGYRGRGRAPTAYEST